jgi:tRNA (guanine9-N1)-methyltransferase
MLRNYNRRKRRGDALREEESQRLATMDEQQQAEYQVQQLAEREAAKAAAAEQRARVARAMEQGMRVVIDCSFTATPSPDGPQNARNDNSTSASREVRSLCKQLELCAAANKRAACPVSLHLAGFVGPVQQFAVESMGADRWPAARVHEGTLQQLYAREELVVLSPDAQEPLLELDPAKVSWPWGMRSLLLALGLGQTNCTGILLLLLVWSPHRIELYQLQACLQVYVIGGLVDRTVQKGASLKLAQRCGAAAARLPIPEFLGSMPPGKGVLNVNDVFSALLAVAAGEGWQTALERAIPQRWKRQQQQQQQTGQEDKVLCDTAAGGIAVDAAVDVGAAQKPAAATPEQSQSQQHVGACLHGHAEAHQAAAATSGHSKAQHGTVGGDAGKQECSTVTPDGSHGVPDDVPGATV